MIAEGSNRQPESSDGPVHIEDKLGPRNPPRKLKLY